MASRKRLESESYDKYKSNLKIEAKYAKIYLRGVMDAESMARNSHKRAEEEKYRRNLSEGIAKARARLKTERAEAKTKTVRAHASSAR